MIGGEFMRSSCPFWWVNGSSFYSET